MKVVSFLKNCRKWLIFGCIFPVLLLIILWMTIKGFIMNDAIYNKI